MKPKRPCSSLFSLSVSKLHQSLRPVELRRLQGEMQPGPGPILQDPSEGSSMPSALACNLSEPSWRLMSPASLSPPVGGLLSDGDSSAFPDCLEDSVISVSSKSPHCLCSALRLNGLPTPAVLEPWTFRALAAGYLLEDGLESVLEDIDTSMFDCSL